VAVGNSGDAPVTVGLQTPFGARTLTDLGADTKSSHAFSTRLGALPAGSYTATLSGTVDGKTVTEERALEYDARTC